MNPPPRLTPQAGPAAWNAAALGPTDWMIPVGAELGTELAGPDSPRPQLTQVMQQVAERLEHGRGFVLLRGLPLDRLAAGPGLPAVALAIAALLGTVLAQDATGTRVGPDTAAPGEFHAEPADAAALLCVRSPAEGAAVLLTSAAALHNALLKADRAALAQLHQPFPHRGGEAGNRIDMPVFSIAHGSFVGRYDRAAMPESELLPAQLAALAALDAAVAQPGQAMALPLRAGDMLFYNPHLVWRQRTAPAPEQEFLRLWLTTPGSRALPGSFRAVFRETAAGAPRGGVATPDAGPKMVGG